MGGIGSMANDICGVDLVYAEGSCKNRAIYSDGKCGIHSRENKNGRRGRTIQEPLLNDFLTRERRTIPENTYDSRITGLRAFDEWLEYSKKDILSIGPLSIEDFVGWVQSSDGRGVSDGTAEKYIEQVSKFYQYLAKKEREEYGVNTIFAENPVHAADLSLNTNDSEMAKKLHNDDGYVAISADDFDALMEHIQPPKARNQLIFQLMWDTGLRPIEICNIRLTDIDRENREIAIRSEKTHLNRTVFFGEKVATMLGIWLEGGERDRYNPAEASPYLLISERSEKMRTHTIENAFRSTAKAADLYGDPVYIDANGSPKFDLHLYSIRHGFAERMVEKPDVDLETLRDAMGHQSVDTTMKYLNPDKETRRRRMQRALDE